MKPDGHSIGQSEGEATKSELLRYLQDLEPRVKELEQETRDLREELSDEGFTAEDGRVTVPSGAGLGVDIDTAALDRYRTGED